MELDALWDYALETSDVFEQQREFFFQVLELLLREGAIDLIDMRTKVSMLGDVDEQLRAYLVAFPKDAREMDGGMWFFRETCPGGPLWRPEAP
ncbi:hypothetical protein ACQ859_23480 [Roseateles chitinivorans]|uniref:hypothetical protein n=1 Tax=Roseateles chitinivorans TaxID=2917965 RepID=UPI003D671945